MNRIGAWIVIAGLVVATAARAQSPALDGKAIAFDRGKGNCLSCHDIKGGELPGTIGPALSDIKARFPDRNELVGIVTDETRRRIERDLDLEEASLANREYQGAPL